MKCEQSTLLQKIPLQGKGWKTTTYTDTQSYLLPKTCKTCIKSQNSYSR